MIETPKANLSRGMRQLNGVYTQRFNRIHRRVGHVFQGRFSAILVEKDAHLLELCRYIVRNPVAAELVDDVSAWPWSSYRATAGVDYLPEFLSTSWLLDQFGGNRKHYRKFVSEGGHSGSSLANADRSNILGSEKFRYSVQQHIKSDAEVPRAQRYVARRRLKELEADVADRCEWMAQAYREHGYTMREIAAHARVHYSLVSKLIKAWEQR